MTRFYPLTKLIDSRFDDIEEGEITPQQKPLDWDDEEQQHQFICLQRWQDRNYNVNIADKESAS